MDRNESKRVDEDRPGRVLYIGSKMVASIDSTGRSPIAVGALYSMNDQAVPEHLLLGSMDIPYPTMSQAEAAVAAHRTVGFLRSIEDMENTAIDITGLKKIGLLGNIATDQSDSYCNPLIVVPSPLGLLGRERLINTWGIHRSHPKSIFSTNEALVLAYIHSEEGSNLLNKSLGRLQIVVADVGEDYCCISAMQIESILAHDNASINEFFEYDHETSFIDSQYVNVKETTENSEVTKNDLDILEDPKTMDTPRSNIYPISRLNINTLTSEGNMGFGFHDMDEVVLQDWLAILYHLAKSMRVKKPDSSWRLSKEALDGHNSNMRDGLANPMSKEENVNAVEGFRWWVKLSPSNRNRCLQALSLFRMSSFPENNMFDPTQTDSTPIIQSFYQQLMNLSTHEKRIELLSDFLFDECDSILQTLTGWVSIQSGLILKQLLDQYGEEVVKVEIKQSAYVAVRDKAQTISKTLVIDSAHDIVFDDDSYSQNENGSMAGTIFYDIYTRPTLKSHMNQLVKGLSRKLKLTSKSSSLNSEKFVFDGLLLWHEVSCSEMVGHDYVNKTIVEELSKAITIRECEQVEAAPLHFPDYTPYSCGIKMATAMHTEKNNNSEVPQRNFVRCPSTLLLRGLSLLAKNVASVSSSSVVKDATSPLYNNLTFTEIYSNTAWCGNLGFALVCEDGKKSVENTELVTDNIVWLTDFHCEEVPHQKSRRRLKADNSHLLQMSFSEPHEEDDLQRNTKGLLVVHACRLQEVDAGGTDWYHSLEDVLSQPLQKCFFTERVEKNLLLSAHSSNSHSTGYFMVTSDEDKDFCGKCIVNVQQNIPEVQQHHAHNLINDSPMSALSLVHSADQLGLGESHYLSASSTHTIHHDRSQRTNHSFYQRSNRHRRSHAVKHHHFNKHHIHQHGSLDIVGMSSHHSSLFNSPLVAHQAHVHKQKASERQWKLLLVRSTSFYNITNAVSALLGDSEDSHDIKPEETNFIVQENIHILHSFSVNIHDPNQDNQLLSIRMNNNGTIDFEAVSLLSVEDMIQRFPKPEPPEELALVSASSDVMEELESFKREILSFVPLIDLIDEQHQPSDDPNSTLQSNTPTSAESTSLPKRSKLSSYSSKVATLTFTALGLLMIACCVFIIYQFCTIWLPILSNQLMTESPFSQFPPINDKDSQTYEYQFNTKRKARNFQSSSINNNMKLDPEFIVKGNSNFAFSTLGAAENESRITFTPNSHIARLRYAFRRIKGSIVEKLATVKNAVFNTFRRFPFVLRVE